MSNKCILEDCKNDAAEDRALCLHCLTILRLAKNQPDLAKILDDLVEECVKLAPELEDPSRMAVMMLLAIAMSNVRTHNFGERK
ncbi:MAG: hypothetical protein V3W37_03040 [Candidatus Binatia bacterium]